MVDRKKEIGPGIPDGVLPEAIDVDDILYGDVIDRLDDLALENENVGYDENVADDSDIEEQYSQEL